VRRAPSCDSPVGEICLWSGQITAAAGHYRNAASAAFFIGCCQRQRVASVAA